MSTKTNIQSLNLGISLLTLILVVILLIRNTTDGFNNQDIGTLNRFNFASGSSLAPAGPNTTGEAIPVNQFRYWYNTLHNKFVHPGGDNDPTSGIPESGSGNQRMKLD